MSDSHTFALDVFRTVCARLEARAEELRYLVDSAAYEEWLVCEAFLACKTRETTYPFCEVVAKPAYASEGVTLDDTAGRTAGDLRVGGPAEGANHCWLFAEFVLLHHGNRGGEGTRRVEAAATRLRRLGWKKSAALLVVMIAGRGDALTDWATDLDCCDAWNGRPLTAPVHLALPGDASVVVKALDIKQNLADTLAAVFTAR